MKMDKKFDLIKLSLDNGISWETINLPGKREWNENMNLGIPRWVEPLAWDKEDRLYALWSEGQELKLGITNNNGESWREHTIVQSKDTLYFPYIKMSEQLQNYFKNSIM